jgi:hypothetical protein
MSEHTEITPYVMERNSVYGNNSGLNGVRGDYNFILFIIFTDFVSIVKVLLRLIVDKKLKESWHGLFRGTSP